MAKKYPGGLITKTPITPTGPYENGSASGVWSMEQMQYWLKQGLWPIAGNIDEGDLYYKYVTMLLNGNGTNGSQNNTFLDSSSNAFTITRNGNTTQGSFSPYGSLWSNFLNGSSGLRYTTPASYYFGTGDFTVECWVNFSGLDGSGGHSFIGDWSNSTGNAVWGVFFNDQNNLLRFIYGANQTKDFSWTPSIGVWYHIAMCRSSETLRCFINGTQIGSDTAFSNNINNTYATGYFYIGMANSSASYLNGYISNIRVNNTALYTSNFTPSTTPLTAVSGTIGLMCQSNRFIDNSSTNSTITVYTGSPSIQRFSPFEPSSPGYTTATIGGSGYFDGSGDYLRTPANNTAFGFGTGEFTIEAWIYPTLLNSNQTIWGPYGNANTDATHARYLFRTSNGNLQFAFSYTSWVTITSSTPVKLNAWNHVAATRVGNDFYIWLNGVQVGTTNNSVGLIADGTNPVAIGAYYTDGTTIESSSYFSGYISNLRVVKGTAVYTSAFTPPTAPLTAISGTQLLTNMIDAGIPDYAMMNDLETVGNAQVSTSVKKFGTGSIYLPNPSSTATDYLTVTNNSSQNIYFGSANFTIEAWVYLTETAPDASPVLMQMTNNTGDGCFAFVVTSGRNIRAGYTTTGTWQSKAYNTTSTISLNTWAHIAWVRDGSTMYTYVNGVSGGSYNCGTDVIYYSSTIPVRIGTDAVANGNANFTGYIDDLRVTKGYCRYPSGTTFTPPTQAFSTF